MDVFVFILLFTFLSVLPARAADLENLYGRQIAWAAANLDDAKVANSFRDSFKELLADKNKVAQMQTPEGQKILQQGQNLLGVIQLKERLEKCLLSHASAKDALKSLTRSMQSKSMESDVCGGILDEARNLQSFNRELGKSFKEDARTKILNVAKKQLNQTRSYWEKAAQTDHLDLAVELTDREREIKSKPPQTGTELLLYTKAIRERKNKVVIKSADVKNAFAEVQSELKVHEDYLKDVSTSDVDEALQRLIVTNPGAAAHYLIENPAAIEMVCKSLQDFDEKAQNKDFLDKAMFWGGLVVGGVLLATGIGAGVGAMVLSGTAAATTLTTVAAGAAIAGTVAGSGEAVYSSSRAYESFHEARALRASAFAENASEETFSKADKAKQAAYSELADAGFSAASIIPFGSGLKVMKSAAQASRLGSYSRVAKEGAKIEAESVKGLATSLKEVSADKEVLKILENSQKNVSSDEMGMFLGYMSHLPKNEREQMLELMKKKPEKVSEAIKESAKNGVCK